MGLFISDAYAQAESAQESSLIGAILPLILFLGIFWFLLLRPQQKRQKEHKIMVQALKKGDEVVTNGGLLGKVTKVGDTFVSVEIAQGQEVNIQRSAVQSLMPKGTIKSL